MRSATSGRVVGAVFALVGIGLLAGATAAYYYTIHRPQTWPQVPGTVVSSRVVNPTSPSQYKPEIVFDLDEAGARRQVTTLPSWSSGSYDMVRAYVEGYPPGTRVSLAVNPADSNDVRYELGLTLTTAILPAALGAMGLLFAAIGLSALRPRARAPVATAPATSQSVGWIGTLFAAIGLLLGSIGGWLLTQDTVLDWPTIDAEAVGGTIISGRTSSSRNSSSRPTYDIQVTFRYEIDGTSYKSQTASGSSSGSREAATRRLEAYAPGTRHAIHYRPDDPNIIRFEVSRFDVFLLPLVLLFMGVVFTGVGLLVSRALAGRRR